MDKLIVSAIISGVSIIIGAIIQSKWRLTIFKNRNKYKIIQDFPNPDHEKYNVKFYEYLNDKIGGAEKDIFVTGDGMNFADKQGKEIAEKYHASFKYALKNGVNVVRVQTVGQINNQWADMLKELIPFDNFTLCFPKKLDKSNILSLCTIDPHSEKKCVMEMMLPHKANFGDLNSDVAGAAVFFTGYHSLARDITTRIQDMINDSVKIKTAEELDKYIINNK